MRILRQGELTLLRLPAYTLPMPVLSPRQPQLAAQGTKIPYLDGLRAYSILLVLLNHTLLGNSWLQPKWYLRLLVADGNLGVRVFFVLSGFLITTLLLNEEDLSGRISIRGFYERRIARIFPAAYLYIGTIAVLSIIGLDNDDKPLAFLIVSTFTANLGHIWRQFGDPGHGLMFGHFWTLSVEEQFYLFWPSILVFLGRRWARRLAIACVILLPVFRALANQYMLRHPALESIRGSIVTRTSQDVIMWGALAAFAARGNLLERMRTYRFRWAYPWISLLVVFCAGGILWAHPVFGLDNSLLPTLQAMSTLLFIFWLLSGEGGPLRWGLESWPVVQLGLLSYSLYIWQQPFTQEPRLRWLHFPFNIVVALLVAAACYHFVERPMRKLIRQWFSQPLAAH